MRFSKELRIGIGPISPYESLGYVSESQKEFVVSYLCFG